jgi:hypothetical protein
MGSGGACFGQLCYGLFVSIVSPGTLPFHRFVQEHCLELRPVTVMISGAVSPHTFLFPLLCFFFTLTEYAGPLLSSRDFAVFPSCWYRDID